MLNRMMGILSVAVCAAGVTAAPTSTTSHDASAFAFDGQLSSDDLIQGLIATELAGDLGWHSANTNPADQLPSFTDGAGVLAGNLTGLLNDLDPPTTGVGFPVKIVQYDLAGPSAIGQINILTGNNLNADGRIHNTVVVKYSTNNGGSFQELGYFESDPLGSVNGGNKSTFLEITDDSGGALATGVTNLIFEFYPVSNTQGQYRDPFGGGFDAVHGDGVNPFTGLNDAFDGAFESPLVWEIDVLVPEPASLALLGLGGLMVLRRRRA